MRNPSRPETIREVLKRIARLFRKRREPEDPYAMVMAPKKPRPPHRSAAAVADLPDR